MRSIPTKPNQKIFLISLGLIAICLVACFKPWKSFYKSDQDNWNRLSFRSVHTDSNEKQILNPNAVINQNDDTGDLDISNELVDINNGQGHNKDEIIDKEIGFTSNRLERKLWSWVFSRDLNDGDNDGDDEKENLKENGREEKKESSEFREKSKEEDISTVEKTLSQTNQNEDSNPTKSEEPIYGYSTNQAQLLEQIESFSPENQSSKKNNSSNITAGDTSKVQDKANNTAQSSTNNSTIVSSQKGQVSSKGNITATVNVTIYSPVEAENEPSVDKNCLNQDFYHFPNGSCLSSCPSNAFVIKTDPKLNQLLCIPCDISCSTCKEQPTYCTSCPINLPYLYQNNSCLATCSSEAYMIIEFNNIQSCVQKNSSTVEDTANNKPIGQNHKEIAQAVTTYTSTGGTIAVISTVYAQVLGHTSSSTASKILLINLIEYIKYLNINYPPRLTAIFKNQVQDIISFEVVPPFPDPDADEISEYTTTSRFSRYDVNGLFIVNFWEEIITLMIIIFAALLFKYLNKKNYQNPFVNQLIGCLKRLLVWNFLIVFLLSNLGDTIIYACVEISSLKLDSFLAVGSFFFDLVFLSLYIILQLYILFKLIVIGANKDCTTLEEKIKTYEKVKILFENVKNQYLVQEMVIAIINTRVIFSGLIIGAIDAPTTQCVLLILLHILMLTYLGVYRPFRENWKNLEIITYELISLAADIVCLKLSLMQPADQYADDSSEEALIIINILLISLMIFFQIIEIVVITRHQVRLILENRQRAKVLPLPHAQSKPITSQVTVNDVKNIQDTSPQISAMSKEVPASTLTRGLSTTLSLQTVESMKTLNESSPESTPKAIEPVTFIIKSDSCEE